ncbi:LOG family protein [Streptomyces huasconensis]|uniref:LOG family protein n=1 Tax=Streptomyces huasconensis TaxID=1854574 RepID=UPI0037008DEE
MPQEGRTPTGREGPQTESSPGSDPGDSSAPQGPQDEGTSLRSLCVFCGAGTGARPSHTQLAAQLGRACAWQGIRVVYGAGGVGVMGALSDAVLAEKGKIVGVIPQALMDREYGRTDLTDLRIVQSMHARKALMHRLSDAFIALPGGYGTLEELFEITAWAQLRLHQKPIVLLDCDGFFEPLRHMLDHARDEGFISPTDRLLVQHASTVKDALHKAARLPYASAAAEGAPRLTLDQT